MTQEHLTPEQLAEKLGVDIIDTLTRMKSRPIGSGKAVYDLIYTAITQATEPLQREIETVRLKNYSLQGQMIQLESDNALLVEAINTALPEIEGPHMGNWQPFRHAVSALKETLTNTTQAAQARDKRIREAVIDDVLRLIDTQTHTSELGDPYRHMRSLVEQLKGGQ